MPRLFKTDCTLLVAMYPLNMLACLYSVILICTGCGDCQAGLPVSYVGLKISVQSVHQLHPIEIAVSSIEKFVWLKVILICF